MAKRTIWMTAAACMLIAAPAFATEVNCGAGETIGNALNGRAKTIVIKGACTEDITIEKDGVALVGDDGDPGVIYGAIRVAGARGVSLSNLTLRGGSPDLGGVTVEDGAVAEIIGLDVNTNGYCGVWARNASLVKLTDSQITGHDTDEDYAGVCVGSASTIRGTANTIADNYVNVSLFQHGTYIGHGETIGYSGEVSYAAAEAGRSSYLEFRNNGDTRTQIWGNIGIGRLSFGSLRRTTLNGSILGAINSVVEVRSGSVVTGSVFCDSTSVCPQ